MSEPVRCASCGQPLEPPGPGGLCPVCLLRMGLDAAEGPDTAGAPTSGPTAATAVPGVIGPYHLLQVLGEGGMGLVYLAEQREPLVRRVALKLIKPGMDTREVLARFETERQALALMDHPSIARVLDAGLGPGDRPYFVMEDVAGVPITDYCDRHRLPNAERLPIFLQVCAALQHAHQKGIIHRDLKPSNILVTVQDGKPVPKVIDFGIAKATRQGSVERAAFTQLGMLIGTPEYISPEQAEASGLEVDTTTDIYSLGVVLYELLTGVLPFDSDTLRRAGYAEMHRIIREQDPPKPSLRVTALGAPAADIARQHQTTQPGLGKQLRGDLDAIAMKAMEKDRTRRYASASEFASDITRYLNGEAVVASPPGVVYRTRKFVRRHRLGVVAAALVVASLAAGLAVSTGLYLRAEESRRETERQRTVADQQSYLANLASADLLLRSNDTAEAKKRLASAPEALRGWEWRLLDRQASVGALTFELGGTSRAVAFQDDATIRALVRNGEERMRVVTAHLANPDAGLTVRPGESPIALSPDGRLAVVTNAMGKIGLFDRGRATGMATLSAPKPGENWFVHVRDVATGRTVAQLDVVEIGKWTGPCPPEAIYFGPFEVLGPRSAAMTSTGKTVAVTSGQRPYLVDAAFSANGARVAAWSWGNVIGVWDVVSGRQIASLKGHADGVTAVAFTPSASRLVSASFDGTVRVWDLARGRQIAALEVPGGAWALAGSPDGRWIAAGAPDGTIRVWNGAQLNLAWSARLNGSSIRALGFSPDSLMLASGARDIRIWDSATGAGLSVVRAHRGTTDALAFGPDGLRLVSTGDDQTLRVTNLADADLRVVGRHGKPATVVAFGSDNESLVSAAEDGTVRTWRATTARLIRTMEVPGAAKGTLWGWPWFSLSRDGRLAASWVEDDTAVHVWDTTTGERVRTLAVHEGRVERWEFTADGRRLVVASGNGQIRTWDIATGGLVGAVMAQSGSVLAPLHSPGRMLILTREGRAQLLDLDPIRLGATLGSVARDSEDDWPTCAAVREGDDAVVVGTGSGSLSLLELRPGAQARALKASGPTVTDCAYSPDGRRIAAAFVDGTVGLWDTNTLEHVVKLTLDSAFASSKKPGVAVSLDYLPGIVGVYPSEPINYAASLAFSPDGSKLATAWADGAVRIWNASAKPTDNWNDEERQGFLREAEAVVTGAGARPAAPGAARK